MNFNIFAISDLHLAISNKEKSMEVFEGWTDYTNKIKKNWLKKIKDNDICLIPGDISWAMKFEDSLIDLNWINNLPGRKVILRGNHDYWWPSYTKLSKSLPKSIFAISNNVINFENVSIGGSKLFDSIEYNFDDYINFVKNPLESYDNEEEIQKDLKENILLRELNRLTLSLEQLNKDAKYKIALTHYPPISADLKDSRASKILERFNIDKCIFGHLHSVNKNKKLFGEKNKIDYILASADYINFDPIKIY